MKWKVSDFVEYVGYLGPHCIVSSLYFDVLRMNVVSDAHTIAHPHAAPIIIKILHFVIWVSGRVIDKYLCILIYIKVCIDVIRNAALQKLFIKHRISPKIQSFAINVVRENGANKTPTKKSAMAKFTKNMLVLVRMPLWRITTAMTMRLPKIANTIEIDIHVPKIAVSRREKCFRDKFPNAVEFPISSYEKNGERILLAVVLFHTFAIENLNCMYKPSALKSKTV